MRKNFFVISLLLVLVTGAVSAVEALTSEVFTHSVPLTTYPEPTREMLEDFERYIEKTMKEWDIPGMAVGIVQGDKTVYSKGFGIKTIGKDALVDPDTIFQIGSITKSFAAALTAMLVDEGKFKWDDKVTDYLPDFMLSDSWVTREFQVVDLMAQRSGLPSHVGDLLYLLRYDGSYIKQVLHYIQPVSSFRTQHSYVNVFYLFVRDLIEKFVGKSWEQAVAERIFIPLGMSNSSADMHSVLTGKNVASPHAKVNDKMVALDRESPFPNWTHEAGPAGSISSTVTDMLKWLSFQMSGGKVGDKRLISEKNMNFIHAPKTPMTSDASGGNSFYALGWVYRENQPLPIIWHNGSLPGRKSVVAFVPEAKVGIVILSNSLSDLPELLVMRFFDTYFGKTLQDYSSKKLTEDQKIKNEAPPKDLTASLPLERYAGKYFNKIYGESNISIVDGELIAAFGNKGLFKINLSHWDRDIFMLSQSLHYKSWKNDFMRFEMNIDGEMDHFTIDSLKERFHRL